MPLVNTSGSTGLKSFYIDNFKVTDITNYNPTEPWGVANGYTEGVDIVNGRLKVTVDGNYQGVSAYYNFEQGKTYFISADIDMGDFDGTVNFKTFNDVANNIGVSQNPTESGNISMIFTANATEPKLIRARAKNLVSGLSSFYIDNFKVIDVTDSNNIVNLGHFKPDVLSFNDYFPFGMIVPNRSGSDDSYRYGFQGQEKDDEIKGEGNSLNYTFRMHDPRVGRFFAPDPLEAKYPYYSPYQFSGNRVLDMIELEGLEPTYTKDKNGNAVDEQGEVLNQGDKRNDVVIGRYSARIDSFVFHEGNDNASEGFYTEEAYKYTQLDTENGQVLPPMTNWEKFPIYTEGSRSWHGNGVDSKGYLTGEAPTPDLTLAIGMFGGGKSKLAQGAIVMMGNAKKTVVGWTIYQGMKKGEKGKFLLYIGKSKNGTRRYSIDKLLEYSIQPFAKLRSLPDNGTALGVEQLIMELNGWKGKASNIKKPVLSNKINAAAKAIYKSQGKAWLNNNIKDWEKLFKIK